MLVCSLDRLCAMAGTITLYNEPKSNIDLQSHNVPITSDNLHSRQKREENETLEETFDMKEFVNIMKRNVVDLVVILDRSWGMGKRDFYLQQKKLLRSIINQYTILHPNYMHLAIITFALTVEVPIDNITPGNGTALSKAELFYGSGKPWEQVLYRVDPSVSKVRHI